MRPCIGLLFFVLSSLFYGQPWSGVISSSRAIDWGGSYGAGLPPTLPDGETTTNPWTPPSRTQCSALNPSGSDDVPQITSAISTCAARGGLPRGYVLLNPGTFQIQSKLALDGAINVSLRGTGPQTTKLSFSSASGWIVLGDASGGGTCSLTSGSNYAKGSTSLTCTGATPPVGQPVGISQCDTGISGAGCTTGTEGDNGSVWICGQQSLICTNQPVGNGQRGGYEHQMVQVTAVSGTCSSSCTVTITPGLYMPNWAFARTPIISWNDPTYTTIGVGVEDMTLDFTAGGSTNFGTLAVNNAYAVWVKGVRFVGAANANTFGLSGSGLSFGTMGNVLLSNNYYFSTNPLTGAGVGLPINIAGHSAVLFQNNITEGGGISSMEQQGFNSGNVYAYNYALNNSTGQAYNGDAQHSASPNFELREGNFYGPSEDDATWGTHNFDTWFRNYISCYDPPYSGLAAPRGILMDNWARFENVIGNALGTPGQCTAYTGTGGVLQEIGFGASDSLSQSTAMLWGNYSTVRGANQFNSSEVPSSLPSPNTAYSNSLPGSNTLPASFYMDAMTAHPSGGTGLSWWKVCTAWTTFPTNCSATSTSPMPPLGPDVTGGPYIAGHAYATPAVLAWNNLPIDTAYQNSYTITLSSWSSGTEILTVSGLYGSAGHIMGGFQLSGVNSACLPSSGVSYTGRPDGEILMTHSTTATISYALTSNPGVSCTGTFKFPDVRQFDQRAYQTDVGGPVAPTITTTSPLASGVVGVMYSQLILASGDPTITWTIANKPAWMTGCASTTGSSCTLSGTPTTATTYSNIQLTATNSVGNNMQTFSLTIGAGVSPSISPTSLPSGIVGTFYTQTLTGNNFAGAITWSVTGSLPAGLSGCSGSTCVISGTPTTPANYSFTINATDGTSTINQPFNLVIAPVGTVIRFSGGVSKNGNISIH